MSEKKVFDFDFHGKKISVEYGELGKQANATVLVRYEDTAVLTSTVAGKKPANTDFFPLLVQYTEKLYAGGKIPGGFLRREGRQSEAEILNSRVIDRTLRPLFPEGYRNEVQVINYVVSSDSTASPEMTALLGSSIALTISDIPFDGPVAGVVVGRINGELVINPSKEEMLISDIDLTVSGTVDAINMVEAGAKQVSEDDMLDAMMFAHENIKVLIGFINSVKEEVGKEKQIPVLFLLDEKVYEEVKVKSWDKIKEAMLIFDKQERSEAIDKVNAEIISEYENNGATEEDIEVVAEALHEVLKNVFRLLITKDKVRPDGRKANELRDLDSQIDILQRTHGSALFTRGQTQSLSIATLGAIGDHQIIDGLGETSYKRFMLHYNFPQFSVGETGRYGAPGRREIGHGALGERALAQVIPSEEDFPYTIRIVSEILESNGSSSQASICAGCMSLMAAGVPIVAPVAGIAMGLISEGSDYIVLTDIQGLEDHLGDMDFKVAGTKDGITALQMDIKIKGITRDILKEALAQAKEARLIVLENMMTAISTPRVDVSKYAPKVKIFMINPDKIRDVIGPGGKMITSIIEQCDNVKIDIEQDGKVVILHQDKEPLEKAYELIYNIVREVEMGINYLGTVTRVEKFGCFVEIWPGTEGLVHISKLDHKRIEKVEDVCKVGDQITVRTMEYDERGRLNLSRKDAMPKPKVEEKPVVAEEK